MLRQSLQFAFFLFSGTSLLAQDFGEISGHVVDKYTGKPIPFATVFFDQSSMSTLTDSLGNYHLQRVPIQFTELVTISAEHQTLMSEIELLPGRMLSFDIKMSPSAEMPSSGTSWADGREWRELYNQFFQAFVGTGIDADSCRILNPGVLTLAVLANGTLIASASEPLEIINHASGYKIVLYLKRFEKTSNGVAREFYSIFTELTPKSEDEKYHWQVNRVHAYKGSLSHFLRAIASKTIQSEGFKVYFQNLVKVREGRRTNLRPKNQVAPERLYYMVGRNQIQNNYNQLFTKGIFEIHYMSKFVPQAKQIYPDFPHPVSWLTVYGDFLSCPAEGAQIPSGPRLLEGDMNNYKIADLLPLDFDAVRVEGTNFFKQYSERGSLTGTINENVLGQPIAGANVFINNTFHATVSDHLGKFEMRNISEGVYNLVVRYGDGVVQKQRVEIKKRTTTQVNVNKILKVALPWRPDPLGNKEKNNLFFLFFVRATVNIYLLNPEILDVKIEGNRIRMRSRAALELDDKQRGYKLKCYLEDAEFELGNENIRTVKCYTSFDTALAKGSREREKFRINRDNAYYGSINHLVRSLVQHRSSEEGFEVSAFGENSNGGKSLTVIENNNLLVSIPGSEIMNLRFPKNARISFDSGRPTTLEQDTSFLVSPSGVLFSEGGLKLRGPMGKREIPLIPIDFQPTVDSITDPKVWLNLLANPD